MIRHCVFVRFRAAVQKAEKAALFAEIAALQPLLPGVLGVQIGANVSPEAGMDKGYQDGFIVEFADAAARDAYLVHPEHQEAGRRLVAAAEGGVDGVLVYDMEIAD